MIVGNLQKDFWHE